MIAMRIIGAGIVGVTTAHALAEDGHEVTVFERRNTVATECSFSNAGFLAPGYVTPWAAPGMLGKVLGQWFNPHRAVRLSGWPSLALGRWLWRWQRASAPAHHQSNRQAMLTLAQHSLQLTRHIATTERIDYERAQGMLVLLRDKSDLAHARAGLKLLADTSVKFKLLDASACREVEPALEPNTPLIAGVYLPDAEVGNCRQFAIGLKSALVERSVTFLFNHEVTAIRPMGRMVEVVAHEAPQEANTSLGLPSALPTGDSSARTFDAVVVCAAIGAPALAEPLGLRLPIQAVHGYAITFPVRHFEAHPDVGPRSALMDERYKVAISRLGDRMRVAGSAELGGARNDLNSKALATLYRVVEDWFPSAARKAKAQVWKGARPMLPDGPPAIGASATPGVWVNTGHGSSGWALACGSAQLLADLVAGRSPAVDPERFSPLRWTRT
jgi:D-amino-acid dehydrogenase